MLCLVLVCSVHLFSEANGHTVRFSDGLASTMKYGGCVPGRLAEVMRVNNIAPQELRSLRAGRSILLPNDCAEPATPEMIAQTARVMQIDRTFLASLEGDPQKPQPQAQPTPQPPIESPAPKQDSVPNKTTPMGLRPALYATLTALSLAFISYYFWRLRDRSKRKMTRSVWYLGVAYVFRQGECPLCHTKDIPLDKEVHHLQECHNELRVTVVVLKDRRSFWRRSKAAPS